MRVLLIQPFNAANAKVRGKVYMSQLTLPALAALTPPDVAVSIVDENLDPVPFDDGYDLVGITTLTPSATRAYEIADEFRSRGVRVVLGGVHASLMPEEAREHADALLIGEAEGVWPQLLADAQNGGLKPMYQAEGRPSLASLPHPRHDLTRQDGYLNIPKVETSRGCPFNCNFCSTTVIFGNRMRYRPVEDVVEEVRALGNHFVFFTDNNIVGNVGYAKKLFRALIPLKVKWLSQGSLHLARDPELLRLAAESGCVGMLIGIESLMEEAIASMNKRVNKVAEYARDIRRIHRHGIGLIGCFVFGFDEDDPKVFRKTVRFVRRLNIEVPQFTLLTPYPGTELRQQLLEQGRVLHNDWEKYDVGHVVFEPKGMSAEQLLDGYRRACGRVYSYPNIFWRLARSLPYLRSWYKVQVFLRINLVYRKLAEIAAKTP